MPNMERQARIKLLLAGLQVEREHCRREYEANESDDR